ncbi:MAG: hypothetical protein EA356_03590 [Geminicoccaceae bacterium]|nr:MAG: hypothetical protein EA356_03590 [Geminicoccaceae bacterium]
MLLAQIEALRTSIADEREALRAIDPAQLARLDAEREALEDILDRSRRELDPLLALSPEASWAARHVMADLERVEEARAREGARRHDRLQVLQALRSDLCADAPPEGGNNLVPCPRVPE